MIFWYTPAGSVSGLCFWRITEPDSAAYQVCVEYQLLRDSPFHGKGEGRQPERLPKKMDGSMDYEK